MTPFSFDSLPLQPVRAFLVEAPDGAVRGGHGHRHGRQLLVRVSGRIDVLVRLGADSMAVTLDETDNAVLIVSPVWSQQIYRDDGRLLVFCDTPYDPESYLP